jgi:hypothetical protein
MALVGRCKRHALPLRHTPVLLFPQLSAYAELGADQCNAAGGGAAWLGRSHSAPLGGGRLRLRPRNSATTSSPRRTVTS